MPNLTWHTKSNLTHFVHLSTRQRALLVEVGEEGKKSMRQRELLVEGLTHFFYLSMRQRELLFEGLTHFFIVSTWQRTLLIEVGGRGKKSKRQRELLFEGGDKFFFYLSKRQRALLVEVGGRGKKSKRHYSKHHIEQDSYNQIFSARRLSSIKSVFSCKPPLV